MDLYRKLLPSKVVIHFRKWFDLVEDSYLAAVP